MTRESRDVVVTRPDLCALSDPIAMSKFWLACFLAVTVVCTALDQPKGPKKPNKPKPPKAAVTPKADDGLPSNNLESKETSLLYPGAPAPPFSPTVATTSNLLFLTTRIGISRDGTAPSFGRSGPLTREFVRQSLLQCARREFQLAVRDESLREHSNSLPRGQRVLPEVVVSQSRAGTLQVTVFQRTEAETKVLFNQDLPVPPGSDPFPIIAGSASKWSRAEWIAVLEASGFTRAAAKTTPAPPRAADLDDRLNTLDAIKLFEVVQELQSAANRSDDSVELLCDVARSYAQLGALTEFLWSAAGKVFHARGILAGLRATEIAADDPRAHSHLALAWALAGCHGQADRSLQEAQRLAGADATKLPKWLSLLPPFLSGDFPDLKPGQDGDALAQLLALANVEPYRNETIVLPVAKRILKKHPTCWRAYGAILSAGNISESRAAAPAALVAAGRSMIPTIRSLRTLPPKTKLVLESLSVPASVTMESLPREAEARTKVIASLVEAGRDLDRNVDPSWDALAVLISEIGFMQAQELITLERFALGIPVDARLDRLRPLFVSHPFAGYLEATHSDPQRARAGGKVLIDNLNTAELQFKERIASGALFGAGWRVESTRLEWIATTGFDPVYGELSTMTNPRSNPDIVVPRLRASRIACPNSPLLMAWAVRQDWSTIEPQAAEWAKKFEGHAILQASLAEQFAKQNRLDEAEACRRKAIDLDPSAENFRELSNVYRLQRKKPESIKALKDGLKQVPSTGLAKAELSALLAERLMEDEDFRAALPYAEDAAESGAYHAMLTCVRCYNGLERFKEAEAMARRISERYELYRSTWYLWCVYTGRGNLTAAEKFAARYYVAIRPATMPVHRTSAGLYAYLHGDLVKSAKDLQSYDDELPNPGTNIRAAVVHWEAGQPEKATSIWKSAVGLAAASKRPSSTELVPVIPLIRPHFDGKPPADLDLEGLDAALSKLSPEQASTVARAVAAALLKQGKTDRARGYLEIAAKPMFPWPDAILARDALRRMKE